MKTEERSDLLQAIARGYCHEENSRKTLDEELCFAIASEVQKLQQTTLSQWQMFASYCRSCALSGEHNPCTFEEFVQTL